MNGLGSELQFFLAALVYVLVFVGYVAMLCSILWLTKDKNPK